MPSSARKSGRWPSAPAAKMAHEQASMEKSETVYPKSFSCGIVTVPKLHGEVDVNDILRRADEAMYCQKKERCNIR
jgi:PleD family two-component response regulator